MTKAEVKSMMNDADFNGDGKLDYEEVFKKLFFFKQKTAYEIASCLVGSEIV